jgi:NADH-quinone oxidoreductase subunit L
MILSLILVPIVGAVAAARIPRRAEVIAAAALAATAVLGVWAAAGEAASSVSWGPQLELTASVEQFARVMVVLVPLIALPVTLYAAAVAETVGRVRLVALLTAFAGAMELLVVANDLLTLLIGWELVGAFSWILIAHESDEASNAQKATHAFITTRLGDLGLYVAAGITFASTGSFAFSAIADSGATELDVIAGGILVAAAAKSAQIPFSPWLFSAMAGPTPVSALLHSSTMVAAGAYLLIRLGPHLVSVEWFASAVIAFGLAGALSGGLVAAVHRHPKHVLAGSTTAQYGLMFVAIGAGSIVAAAAQLVTHAAFKSLLFLTAGTAMHAAGSDDLGDMRLGRRMPLIGALAAIGALALGGLPPLGGAWSKEQILGSAFELSPALGTAVLVATLLSAFYALRYWSLAFGPLPLGGSASEPAYPPNPPPSDTTPIEVRLSIALLASLSVGLAVLWIPAVHEAAAHLVSGEVVPVGGLELALGLSSLAIAAVLVVTLGRTARLVQGVVPRTVSRSAAEWFGLAAASRRLVADPALAMAGALAAFDDRVVDAGIRASVRTASAFSWLLRQRSELSIDGIVNAVGGGSLRLATGTRVVDDNAVDGSVEDVAGAVGRAGSLLRRLQTGLSHHYYFIVTLGVTAIVVALAAGVS